MLLLQLLGTAMAEPGMADDDIDEALGIVVADATAAAVRLAGVCNLAELFRVPHVEASTPKEEGGGAVGPKDKLLGGGGTDI